MFKKIFLRLFEGFIFRLGGYNLRLVRDFRKVQEEKEERKFALARYKKLTNEFEFSKENFSKISELNDMLTKKMEQLFDTALELCEMFVHLQETGHDDFYEFIIRGEINVSESHESKITPVANEETAERIWDVSCMNDLTPCFEVELNYNSDFMFINYIKEKFFELVQHTGVFANPVFDEMKICRALDVIFNKQKCYTLQDALYMNDESFVLQKLFIEKQKEGKDVFNVIWMNGQRKNACKHHVFL